MLLNKQISKTTVNYFSFEWLDTSAISLIDFGDEFTNYQVELSELSSYKKSEKGEVAIQYMQAREIY